MTCHVHVHGNINAVINIDDNVNGRNRYDRSFSGVHHDEEWSSVEMPDLDLAYMPAIYIYASFDRSCQQLERGWAGRHNALCLVPRDFIITNN